MKIWIDITNAPHVRFFRDVVSYFEDRGEEVIVTARQFGDIHNLLDDYGMEYKSFGKHGATLEDKLTQSAKRVSELTEYIIQEKPDIALAKHSLELPRVAFGLGIPSLYILDNEHAIAVNKLTLPLCTRTIAPYFIDVWDLMEFGLDPNTLLRYNGTSEIMHFKNFKCNDNIFEDLGLDLKENEKVILMRPEPSLASYLDVDCHKSVLSPIVESLKEYAKILILPRFKQQEAIFEGIENVTILKPPVDTSSIISKVDIVIGAGGTMNRESAILGTPVISCYPGKTLAVDQHYVDNGLMYRSTDINEIVNRALKVLVDPVHNKKIPTDDLFQLIIDNVYDLSKNK